MSAHSVITSARGCAVHQHVVRRRHATVVVDAEGRGGVALGVEVDDEHLLPGWARAAATLTVVVVLPTPPFWLATTKTRVRLGPGHALASQPAGAASTECSAARASGVA